ncbi:hypothetical protein HHUSO_G4294 [Huso huso]|uniref:Uncharacterized protein n=1 Tax=Huso huso TaxID=61971 RepID=A0ABR1A4P2_HUSHU
MASHQQSRIQSYLENNKIGPLFEEMMTKLISETPDHPIPFLINHLLTKQGSPSKLQRTLSGSAALWAETGTTEIKGTRRDFRSYDKPWQMNPKKPKKSKSDLAVSNISPPSPESKSLPRSIEHPGWDWSTKPESRDFDELNLILQESRKLGKALENLSRCIAVSDEIDQDPRTYNSSLLRPRVIGEWVGREENDADPLAAEMLQPPVPKNKSEQRGGEDSSGSPAGSLKMEPKSKGLKQQQQHHKKLLAAMLSQDSFDSLHSTAPSVNEEEIDDEDDTMELLEDLDDLRMEGVSSLASSGNKFSQGRSSYCPEPQAKVTLNICSRFQGDSLLEARDDEPLCSRSSEQAVPKIACPLPGVETMMEDDEECESASQVTGPRRPVWDSDAMYARSGSSLSQKQLKESFSTKELQRMEKHLAEVEKDLAKIVEATLVRSPNSPHSSLLLTPTRQGNQQALPGQNSRPQTPRSLAGKSSQLQFQGNKPASLANSRPQTPNNQNCRPQTPNTLTSRPRTPSAQGSRPMTPNSLMPQPLTPSRQGDNEGNFGSERSRPVTPTSQVGRPLHSPTGLAIGKIAGENVGNATTQRYNLSEDESYQQLQAARQPQLIPSDTDSDVWIRLIKTNVYDEKTEKED